MACRGNRNGSTDSREGPATFKEGEMEQLSLKTVKTRKPHNCWGCTEEFPKGTEMVRSVTVDQGEFSSCYWCKNCETTLKNLERSGQAVINMIDDVRIFAGCLTGHYDWPTINASVIDGKRLVAALSHIEIEVAHQEGDGLRPVFYCSEKHQERKPRAASHRAHQLPVPAVSEEMQRAWGGVFF